MTEKHWYPFYVGDYSRDTAHLSMLEHGAYRLLLDHYYSTNQPLPANAPALHRICKALADDEQAAVQSVLKQFFVLRDGRWHNERADRETVKRLKISQVRREAAEIKHAKAYAKRLQKPCKPDAEAHAFAGAFARTSTTTSTTTSESTPPPPEPPPPARTREEFSAPPPRTPATAPPEGEHKRIRDYIVGRLPRLGARASPEIDEWLRAGYDFELDIRPSVDDRIAAKGGDIGSFKFFTWAIQSAKQARDEAAAQHERLMEKFGAAE